MLLVDVISAQRNVHPDVEAEERRLILVAERFIIRKAADALLFKDKVGQAIAQLRGEDADACPRQHITQPMFVVCHAHQSRGCGYGIGTNTYPRAFVPVFLGQHGSGHKGGSGMSRRKGMVVGAIVTHHVGGLFQRKDHAAHQQSRESIRCQHPPPRASSFHAAQLHPQHDGCWKVLQVIVRVTVEMRKIIVAEMAEMVILAFNKESSCHQRQADVGHTEGSRIGQPVDELPVPLPKMKGVDLCPRRQSRAQETQQCQYVQSFHFTFALRYSMLGIYTIQEQPT